MSEEEESAAVEALMREWRLEEATVLLERRLGRSAVSTRTWHDLSVLYAQQGLFAPALDCIEKAMERDPANRAVWHHYLAIQKNNPVQPSDAAWKSMHLRFGDTLRETFDARHLSVSRSRDPGARLRVGYLSPDTHSAAERFVGPVLDRFNRGAFEVFAYWNHARSLAGALRHPDVLHRSIAGASTEDIVQMILRDRIDILVDIAGHGAGNALPALALRPAPVQLTWLDYLATTGLETVDYRVTDEVADPEGAESRHVESLLRLPVPQWCYSPPLDVPFPPPDVAKVVFGAISVPLKLSAPLLDLWGRLLLRVPGSQLRFLGIPKGRARERIVSAFERAGVSRDRLDIRGRLPLVEFFAELARIDIVLDTFPFSGATATLDALWQGAAAVSLAGRLSHGRSGASILTALGKPQWVAADEDGYLAIAERLARERAQGGGDRMRMREELRASPLCDGGRFVRALEGAYRESWEECLRRTQSIAAARQHANARADILLAASNVDAARCRGLVETLPSHRVTGQLFWREFRAAGDGQPDHRVALREIADIMPIDACGNGARIGGLRDWIAIAADARHAEAVVHATLPAAAIADCDALACFGADAMPHGSLLAAGRGHVGGIRADVEGDAFQAQLWVPHRMRECVVLAGPIVLVRRTLLEARPFPRDAAAPGADSFSDAVSRQTFMLHRDGARLGIVAALAIASDKAADGAERFRRDRLLGQACGTDAVPQTGVAASSLKAMAPASSWPAFARRAERFCDFYRPWPQAS